MNWLADESVDAAVVARLRAEGHDVCYVAELEPGLTDEDVLRRAVDSGSLLLSEDKDFGELVFRLGRAHQGVVLIRIFGVASSQKAAAVAHALRSHGPKMRAAFTVISAGMVRIRSRAPPAAPPHA